MQTNLSDEIKHSELGRQADEILRRCVHCGFCLATCPTYEVLGSELDSPRGRIYQIKEVLEGAPVTPATREHLDRCLTCRNCETTCPSGVEYGHLLDIGRHIVEIKAPRPRLEKLRIEGLRRVITSPWFGPAYRLAQKIHAWLPPGIQEKVQPGRQAKPPIKPSRTDLQTGRQHERQVLMIAGCVQPVMMPSIDQATIRVLDRLGIGTQIAPGSGCCGAVSFHMDAQEEARNQMRRNIDSWWPLIESGQVEAIVVNASGCGAMVREYAHHLRLDPAYADKAQTITEKVLDIAQILEPLSEQLLQQIDPLKVPEDIVFHPPCTLQHWQKLRPITETVLSRLGVALKEFDESHMCCGSAGAYSMLQPEIATRLRDRKVAHIEAVRPQMIVSSNIGCIGQLQSGTDVPVRHWVEVIDQALKPRTQN
ncbi:glycolate oxidase subunit GlcF [Orrella marina]|uniref:Glycolate oxidase iron-sulfur subunit n=1 Tax=Orrella marina TaxID=2163011 RepID=A0A2R4XFT1_9BURK|nr:glycolate oxidase subunit GlcF [Orrella marina]AWB32670.1 glycolate oxidase iron-sulfur subunit [Orrella marina]